MYLKTTDFSVQKLKLNANNGDEFIFQLKGKKVRTDFAVQKLKLKANNGDELIF